MALLLAFLQANAQGDIEALSLLQAGSFVRRARRGSTDASKVDSLQFPTFHSAAATGSEKRQRGNASQPLTPSDVGGSIVWPMQWSVPGGHELNDVADKTSSGKQPVGEPCGPLEILPDMDWRAYLKRVYHEPGLLARNVGVRNFGWFYYKQNPVENVCKEELPSAACPPPPFDAPWTTPAEYPNSPFPILKAQPHGFFVRRDLPEEDLLKASRVEVMHVAWPDSGNASWFWVVQGSGVFLNLDKLRELGQVLKPSHWDLSHEKLHDAEGPSHILRDIQIGAFMEKYKASVLLLPGISHLLPEIVVKIDNEATRNTACPLPNELLSTGWRVPKPCLCDQAAEIMNCDGQQEPSEQYAASVKRAARVNAPTALPKPWPPVQAP